MLGRELSSCSSNLKNRSTAKVKKEFKAASPTCCPISEIHSASCWWDLWVSRLNSSEKKAFQIDPRRYFTPSELKTCGVKCCIHKQLTGLRVSQSELQGLSPFFPEMAEGMWNLWNLHPWRWSGGLWLLVALYEQQGWARRPPEAPSNLNESVTIKAGWEIILYPARIQNNFCFM